ncbi:MAG: hypothetical protein LC808_32485 [Actinobacteria bacterium]|nr:hypothetical protein [Actinomycetota bacterium]
MRGAYDSVNLEGGETRGHLLTSALELFRLEKLLYVDVDRMVTHAIVLVPMNAYRSWRRMDRGKKFPKNFSGSGPDAAKSNGAGQLKQV